MPPSIRTQTGNPSTVRQRRSGNASLTKEKSKGSRENDQQVASVSVTNPILNPYNSQSLSSGAYGGYGGSMYGGGMYGGSMYGGLYGGMTSPHSGPLSGLNQFLFSIQSVVFSLGQAVQIVGMNTQALQQILEKASAMLEQAMKSYCQMRVLEQASRESESPEDTKRRRRLRAMRWAMMVAAGYSGYKLIRLAFGRRRQIIRQGAGQNSYGLHGNLTTNNHAYQRYGPFSG